MKKSLPGFTLIEAILYLALFSILIGGATVCAFELMQAAQYGGTRAMLSEETDFILAKIEWATADAQSVTTPETGATDTALTIARRDRSIVSLARSGADVVIAEGGGTPAPLNNTNVKIDNLSFTHRAGATGEDPEELVTVLTISARTPNGFLLTRIATSTVYVRK